MEPRFYNINEMASLLGMTVAAVHAHLSRSNYDAVPLPIRLGKRLAWPSEQVEEWIQAKVEKAKVTAEKSERHMALPAKMGRPSKTRNGR